MLAGKQVPIKAKAAPALPDASPNRLRVRSRRGLGIRGSCQTVNGNGCSGAFATEMGN